MNGIDTDIEDGTVLAFWSSKGGSGTTTVATSVALTASKVRPTVLVDLGGDVPAMLGMAADPIDGLMELLAQDRPDVSAIERCMIDGGNGELRVLAMGKALPVSQHTGAAIELARLLRMLADAGWVVVVDAGNASTVFQGEALAAAESTYIVIRGCYLALRRAIGCIDGTDGIVFVREPDRALGEREVGDVLGRPVVATVPVDPAVSRAIDAGVLPRRTASSILSRAASSILATSSIGLPTEKVAL